MKPGIYFDVPEYKYHGKLTEIPALSASVIKTILDRSPLHAWQEHPNLGGESRSVGKSADYGKIIHELVLGSKAGSYQVLDYKDFRTKDAQAARDLVEASGRVPIIKSKFDELEVSSREISLTIRENKALLNFSSGRPEVTLIWEENGFPCKARVDMFTEQHFYDLKTTELNANPHSWSKRVQSEYAIQSLWYRRGASRLGLFPTFQFIVGEQKPPYGVSVLSCGETLDRITLPKIEKAIQIWGDCIDDNRWPGFQKEEYVVEAASWQLYEEIGEIEE